jgi:hypothetical protein
MEERVVIRGKMYLVPADRVSGLVAWLESNAVDASQRQPMRESMQGGRELLVEEQDRR